MNKKIETLVDDIYALLDDTEKSAFTEKDVTEFGHNLAKMLANRLIDSREPSVSMSNVGSPCSRQLWYKINTPEKGEQLSPKVRLKFLYGDILEELLLFLAKHAGHKVEGEQDTIEFGGIVGHRDAVIDGVTVDCKSASTFSFKKFENGLKQNTTYIDDDTGREVTENNDPFGYISQLGSYVHGSSKDNIVTDKSHGAFLVMDKTLGSLCLDVHGVGLTLPSKNELQQTIDERVAIVNEKEPPDRAFTDEPEGASGNMKLGLNCSYCAHKEQCWPSMKTYLYARGPVFLTKVVREPKVNYVKKQ